MIRMRQSLIRLALGIGLGGAAILAAPAVRANDPPVDVAASIQKRLQSFDPAAVAAARHYYNSPILKASFRAMVPQIVRAMDVSLQQANPELDVAARQETVALTQEVVTAKIDLITDLSMIAALEVFSKDELVALDEFYSSPTGQSVMQKLPQVMSRLPAMMQTVVPLMLEDVRARMKAKGKDIH